MSANRDGADPGMDQDRSTEVACKTVWPTLAATRLGRWIGRMARIGPGRGPLRFGTFLAVALVPVALVVYVWQILPPRVRRYRLTTRRIVVQKGLPPRDAASLGLAEFDDIRLEVLPGQEYFHAADLVFLRQQRDVLRLPGIPRPQVVRQLCLETRDTFLAIREVQKRQQAPAPPVSSDASAG